MNTTTLHDNWTLHVASPAEDMPSSIPDSVPATVPGCVHTDLLEADLIPDPYLDQNEKEVQWIGYTDWEYRTTFDLNEKTLPHDRIDLLCEGLDTVATVTLNGTVVGETENMHVAHRFDVGSLLQPGPNDLRIRFDSAIRYAENWQEELGMLPHVNEHPYNFIRKMACNFGWDWGPTLVTAGIWKPISLQAWNSARVATVRPLVQTASPDEARVAVHVGLEQATQPPSDAEVHVRIADPEGRPVATKRLSPSEATSSPIPLSIENPERWWPVGHGEQPLYTVEVQLQAGDAVLDTWSSRIGLRTVELSTKADEVGSEFTIKVNDKPILCKGANWIPDDAFPTRIDRAQYRERLQQAREANMNMLRVWGGGLYETDAFYELCDEMGLLVWQDFPFACAFYPEESPFPELIEKEARYNVTRLSSHPSLVLWNGNNENIWFDSRRDELDSDDWRAVDPDRPWGLGYYLETLPAIVDELDPSRPYYPGSPYSGSMERHPGDDDHGCNHVWEAWFGTDYTRYRSRTPRFASEFGHQAPPAFATLRRALPPDQLEQGAPALRHHQKSPTGHERLYDLLEKHFPVPDTFADWHFVTQLNQVRALETGVEWFRSQFPTCTGTLYWQLNDCWPVLSWSAIDGDGRRKLLWYATRRFYNGRLLTIQPEGDALALHACNDTGSAWREDVSLSRVGFDGTVHASTQEALDVEERSCAAASSLKGSFHPEAPTQELLVAEAGAQRAVWFFERDKDLQYPAPRFEADLSRTGTVSRLTLTAETLLRDACLLADHASSRSRVSEQLVTLLPDESFTFEIQSPEPLDIETLTTPPVFQCANYFGATREAIRSASPSSANG
jgi:beta-mannosidase